MDYNPGICKGFEIHPVDERLRGEIMGKERNTKKETKKKPAKSLKEKRKEKKAK
ncbi:MAG: hypothetical protein KOO63_12695 [Bacteroidales bacterium]|nr:hypothetical protein [Candidatus Latescibacterota bacterium]